MSALVQHICRGALAGFFFITGASKLTLFTTNADPVDLAGVHLGPIAIAMVMTFEIALVVGLLTRFWRGVVWIAAFMFLGFAGLSISDLAGWTHTHHCGCLGTIKLDAASRFVMSLGGLITALAAALPREQPGQPERA